MLLAICQTVVAAPSRQCHAIRAYPLDFFVCFLVFLFAPSELCLNVVLIYTQTA